MRIELVTAGQVQVGDWIAEVDDDTLTTDEAINAHYSAEDGAWEQVVATGGHADVGWIDLANDHHARRLHSDQPTRRVAGSWEQKVWRRTDEGK